MDTRERTWANHVTAFRTRWSTANETRNSTWRKYKHRHNLTWGKEAEWNQTGDPKDRLGTWYRDAVAYRTLEEDRNRARKNDPHWKSRYRSGKKTRISR